MLGFSGFRVTTPRANNDMASIVIPAYIAESVPFPDSDTGSGDPRNGQVSEMWQRQPGCAQVLQQLWGVIGADFPSTRLSTSDDAACVAPLPAADAADILPALRRATNCSHLRPEPMIPERHSSMDKFWPWGRHEYGKPYLLRIALDGTWGEVDGKDSS